MDNCVETLSPASVPFDLASFCSSHVLKGKDGKIKEGLEENTTNTKEEKIDVLNGTKYNIEGTLGGEYITNNSMIVSENVRKKYLLYWESAKKEFGVSEEGMLLKKKAKADGFADEDKYEIINILYEFLSENGYKLPVQKLLEIGAGIGRLTKDLQNICKEIVAVDFMEEYVEKNKELHYDEKKRKNDKFLCMDALKLRFDVHTFDIIFWNWLLMYLSDEECYLFIKNVFFFLKPGGFIFCRESCSEPSNKNTKRSWAVGGNPTNYRDKSFYTNLLVDYVQNELGLAIEVVHKEKPIRVYMEKVGTQEQRIWLIKRI